jgi:hypothetical protein
MWVSRWLTDTLTYDALRIASLPWNLALERDRISDIRASLTRFVEQDKDYHGRALGVDLDADDALAQLAAVKADSRHPVLNDYIDVVLIGDSTASSRRRLMKSAGGSGRDEFRTLVPTLEDVNFVEFAEAVERVHDDQLRTFMVLFRRTLASDRRIVEAHLERPLDLARLLTRELTQFVLHGPPR